MAASKEHDGPRWFDLSQKCKYCGEEDWSSEFCERTLLVCSACGVSCAHVGCEEVTTEQRYDEAALQSGCDWFCCEVRVCDCVCVSCVDGGVEGPGRGVNASSSSGV